MTTDINILERPKSFVAKVGRGYAAVGLVQPKTPANVGSVLRAAGCYGVDLVAVEGTRGHNSLITSNSTDTMKAWRHIPTLLTDDLFSILPVGCVPVAVAAAPSASLARRARRRPARSGPRARASLSPSVRPRFPLATLARDGRR